MTMRSPLRLMPPFHERQSHLAHRPTTTPVAKAATPDTISGRSDNSCSTVVAVDFCHGWLSGGACRDKRHDVPAEDWNVQKGNCSWRVTGGRES